VEGNSISVAEQLILPAQPTTGTVDYLPLGGDGFSAPFAAYNIRNFGITGDGSLGSAQLQVVMDQRYCSLIAYVMVRNEQDTVADADIRIRLSALRIAGCDLSETVEAMSALLGVATLTRTWEPPPVVLPGSGGVGTFLNFRMANLTDDDLFLDALIYLFDIRVRELTPMGPILWARGSR